MQTPTFKAREFSTDLKIERSRYGTPTATLWITSSPGTPYRRVRAALHAVAMIAELGTSADEKWVIGIEVSSDLKGYVYVETVNGTDAEARRAMALLGVALDAVFTTGA
jgi:hypothetical protein